MCDVRRDLTAATLLLGLAMTACHRAPPADATPAPRAGADHHHVVGVLKPRTAPQRPPVAGAREARAQQRERRIMRHEFRGFPTG